MARDRGRGRDRPRRDRACARRSPGGDRASHAHRPQDAHRGGQPQQGGHLRRARGAARRRGDRRHQDQHRVPEPRAVLRLGRREGGLAGSPRQRSVPGGRLAGTLRRVPRRAPGAGCRIPQDDGGRTAGRLGREDPRSGRSGERRRDAWVVRQGDPGPGCPRSEPDRRLGGSGIVQQDGYRGGGLAPRTDARRASLPLRCSRARDGRDHERHGASRGHAALRRHLPDLLRLHAAVDAAGRAHGAAGRLRLHPRQRRAGRGRADAPADRAADEPAPDPGASRPSPGRRGRGRRRMADGDGAQRRTHLPLALPPEGAASRS